MQKTETALDDALAQGFPASDPLPMNPGPALAGESQRVKKIGNPPLMSSTDETSARSKGT